jgi:hypothetical protein
MGSLVGGVIGGIGSIIGGNKAAKAEKAAAQQALTGYNYLSTNPLIGQLQSNASTAQGDQNAALGGEAGTVGNIQDLLTSNGTDNPAFKNYLDSTGYNFQLQQGTDAITGSAASKGLLNSGSTGKALEGYGQNLASTTFNNYLGQLGGLSASQGKLASDYGGQVDQGFRAASAVGSAGTSGGGNAAQQTAAAGQSAGTGLAQAANYFGGGVQNALGGGFKLPKLF